MNNRPILSILIPTKNREEYALKVVNHILGIIDNRVQLVIYDNSDSNKLQNLLKDFLQDQRINYFYNSEVLSFVENFSLGISKCTGEYVTIIGDDDGINPLIIDVADWASKNGVEAITPSLPIVYTWPGSGVNTQNDHGRLNISEISCKAKFYNPAKEVIELMKNGCQNYLSLNLAKVYHGMIKRTVLEEIKNRTGKYIGGLSPDIYLSIASSLLVEKVLMIDYPLTISGICKKSGSSDYATGRHTGELAQAPHFRGHINYQWSDKVPAFYSGETIWADSALAALEDLKVDHLLNYFSVDVISAYCIKSYPQFKNIIIKNLAKNHKISARSILIKYYLFKGYVNGPFISRFYSIKRQLFNKKSSKKYDNIADIEQASKIVSRDIEDDNRQMLSFFLQMQNGNNMEMLRDTEN